MKETPIVFNDSVAETYDSLLGPFLFEPYALDLIERVETSKARAVLELACGTGRVTRHLSQHLLEDAQLTATDLSPSMIAVAKQRVASNSIAWATVDMMQIPFKDEQFDLVVCQFGIMFAPDKVRALTEIHRVLKKGGKLLFNTWGPIQDNAIWATTGEVVNSFLGAQATSIFSEGPFCLQDEPLVLNLLEQAGFSQPHGSLVKKTAQMASAAAAAKGFIQGLPVLATIKSKIPAALPDILGSLENQFIQQFGDAPLKANLSALVFEAEK